MDSYENLFLTYEEMEQKYKEFNEKGLSPPYFYQIGNSGQHLFFIGSKHIYDSNDKQNKIIKEHWLQFLETTGKVNCVVLNEGGSRPIASSEEEAINKFGEAGLLTWLAKEDGIEIFSPEPDIEYEIRELLGEFSKEEVAYYYFARLVDQWYRLANRPDFYQYLEPYFRRYKEVTYWEDFDFSVDHMTEIHNHIHDHPFDKEDRDCVANDSHPGKNKIAKGSSIIRNGYIFSKIKELWQEGKNIFIVYGSGHFIILERAIKNLADT